MPLPTRRQALIGTGATAAAATLGAGAWWLRPNASPEAPGLPPEGWEIRAGAFFGPEPLIPDVTPPDARLIRFPEFDGAFAVWGAVGRDEAGQIWVSAASHFVESQSGRLFEYCPETNELAPRGDVLSQLRRLGLYRTGEQQPKIHTKFFQGDDRCLYFASTDDPAPGETLAKPPKWGSHLWRLREKRWEHLLARPEGVLAMAGSGQSMYYLAYPDHLLMQYDCRTGKLRTVNVGSVEGHASRNLFCDFRGHVYVPRLKMARADHAAHTLVEFDPDLREVVEHPLPHYQNGAAGTCHGIVAYQPLPDGSVAFTTHAGRLFRLDPNRGRSQLLDLGWFHPAGQSYAPSLFAFSGERHLVGAVQTQGGWGWVCFDMETARAHELPLNLPTPAGWSSGDAFLYGCTTRDNTGDFYLVGAFRKDMGTRVPIVLRVRVRET